MKVQILDDYGNILGEGYANNYREDLKNAGIGDGKYGFAIDIDLEPSKYENKKKKLKLKHMLKNIN